ncbi:hypothetical protein PPYR_07430 [Photinus pyralis]|uniref:ANKLE2 third alpha/beta domain-containing protein n=2 Tax=Photinus pyralis TaxID=7054 RepID=A0A1Y1N0R9_PHOPY|nr:ankyrin repeat and LEM domain-containing protein 2 isoform X1 [Photinus pyralis]KAB0799550.1 hypothetical protein PPYR_07430 [Photinus pyralis]
MGSQNNIPNGQEISSDTVYYGVHIPYDVQVEHNDESTVFQDKMEAFKLIKKYKQARFKAFHFYHEAVEFAVNGSENHNKLIVYEIQSTKDPPIIGEKPPAFRGPKSQDLVKLRKNIEAGLLDVVSSCIWENPRYLISSGDTPSILQEGSRYNALHVAAKSRNRDMCELILNTVSNTNFIKLLYGDDSHQDANERAVMLLDLYLNTPDKGLNETPLHFAAKFGAVEVVELLVSYSQCDKALLNKYGKTASMIICDRCDSSLVHLKNKIALLLDENFYVPVLRSEDNCIPPVIGEPFSPSSPPNLAKDIFSPRVEIRAYAGPMDRESAARFRRAWKTPPRSLKAANVALNLKFDDLEKGVERLGKNLSMQFDVSWKEYWAFLDEFVDLSTSEGLQIFENYLSERYKAEMVGNDTDSERSTKEIDHDNTTSPMSELCKNFAACSLSDRLIKCKPLKTSCSAVRSDLLSDAQLFKSDLNPLLYVEKSCQVFAHRITNDILHMLEENDTSVVLQTQVKQLELLINSFMDDSRFANVNFHLVHDRLGKLIGGKLKDLIGLPFEFDHVKKTLEYWLELYNKQIDNFSSDDESGSIQQTRSFAKKAPSHNHQVHCLLDRIVNSFVTSDTENVGSSDNEDDYIQMWNDAKACFCTWNAHPLKKSNSFKYTSRNLFERETSQCEAVEDFMELDDEENEIYHTPPSSPEITNLSDDDTFEDCPLPDHDIFIEGNVPTKTDHVAYNAVKFAVAILNPQDYPFVYKWFHTVGFCSSYDRKNWPSPKVGKYTVETPGRAPPAQTSTPISKSWMRVTGTNSPRSTLKRYSRGSLSFN